MPTYQLNDDAVRRARKLIDDGAVDDTTEWSDAAPSADDGNTEIEEHGWDGYASWHLAIDPDANEETKKRHRFPYGDRPAAGSRRELARGGGQGVLLLLQHLDAKRS